MTLKFPVTALEQPPSLPSHKKVDRIHRIVLLTEAATAASATCGVSSTFNFRKLRSRDLDHTRRRLLGAGGVALLSSALPLPAALAQGDTSAPESVSEVTTKLADYVAGTLNRELPANVVAQVKLHILDSLAAAVSGSRLKPGEFAARYAESLGGKPQATVIGTRLLTSPVVAASANGMMAHSDETDDTNPVGPFHPGCGTVPAALAIGEVVAGRTGNDLLRAVTLGYDVGVRLLQALGGTRHNPSCMTNTFGATATAAAMLGLDTRQIRHAFSYAGQMASGIGYWDRDIEHMEKARSESTRLNSSHQHRSRMPSSA